MPVGVITSTSVKSAPAVIPAGPSARFFVAGVTEYGPVGEAVRCRSLADFEAAFGGAVSFSNLHEHMRVFYAEGGYEAYVSRMVGPNAQKASATLDSGALLVTAKQPGAFANDVAVAYESGVLTIGSETYAGEDAAAMLAAAAASDLWDVTSTGSLPSGAASDTTTGGDDDRANITAAIAVAAATEVFSENLGSGAIALPGYEAGDIAADLLTFARSTKRIVLLATARGATLSEAEAESDSVRSFDSEGSAGLFWPWVQTPGGATISPESAVAGARSRAIRARGPWVAPAGGNGSLQYVAGLDQKASRSEIDAAHDDHAVSVITTISGGPRLYGWRSLSLDDANMRYLSYRDTLNMIRVNCESVLEQYVYAPMTPALAQNAIGSIIGVLTPLIDQGGLFPLVDEDGVQVDSGYAVDVNMLMGAQGEGILEPSIAVRIVPAAELIRVPITKVAVGATLA